MPGLVQRNDEHVNGSSYFCSTSACSSKSVGSNGFWSKHSNDINYSQLQKFWTELSPQARWELLRVDKQALSEHARKNTYCSRCNGLLLEGFLQIVMHGRSLQQDGAVGKILHKRGVPRSLLDGVANLTMHGQDEILDPSVHPWGGLTITRDGTLTLLDCYLFSKSLKTLQNVFDSARARERERELLYPDACGGGGRGWTSHGTTNYGRGHGTRETCALHTARLSCDTLMDFWSALGDETQQSLLKMREDDFLDRLMYRFDNKRFCRDCRKNVIREYKELKELKRMHREPQCTSWFCVPDTAFHYEVSNDVVQADWCHSFADTVGAYHHFEWAVGTGEGKSDIFEFENVGMSGSAQVNGLELDSLSACYITLRAWKLDGRYTKHSVKAHALKGQQCVHSRLVVGDGFVSITRGENIRRFFEHAEEVEEDEDDDSMEKDRNELDGECLRPQKHAKSPELAREFLLDAATVIFKEQVEKAFREGTARQNAHSIFVCLALKILEERIHVACKEIITLEKQMKLLEEEEKEKLEVEERKERRRAKEREKKIRRKERLKGKEKDRENNCLELNDEPVIPDATERVLSPKSAGNCDNSVSETANIIPSKHHSSQVQDERLFNGHLDSEIQTLFDGRPDGKSVTSKDGHRSSIYRSKYHRDFNLEPSLKSSERRRLAVSSRFHGEKFDTPLNELNGLVKPSRYNGLKTISRNAGLKFAEKIQCSNGSSGSRSCLCSQNRNYRMKGDPRVGRETRFVNKSESIFEVHRGNKVNKPGSARGGFGRLKSKGNGIPGRDQLVTKKVWEPLESKKPPCNLNSDVAGKMNDSQKNESSREETKNPSIITCELNSSSSTSNSDNLSSSWLSEGESNTATSNSPNTGPSSTSDSEDASQHSEERDAAALQRCSIKSGGNKNNVNPPIKAASFSGAHPRGMAPLVGNLNPVFPVLGASSTMGFYHQNPVSWSAACVPFLYPNHYLLAGPPSPLRHLPAPFVSPVCHPVRREQMKVSGASEEQGRDFSLFHFGGPVAGSSGPKAQELSVDPGACSKKEGAVEEYNLFASSNGIRFSIF